MSIFSKYYNSDLNKLFKQIVPSGYKFVAITENTITKISNFDYFLLPNTLSHVNDVQRFISNLKAQSKPTTRVVAVHFNFLWKPLLDLASKINLREKQFKEPNWLSSDDLKNLFTLEGFDEVKNGKRFIFPIPLWFISELINKYVAHLPIINSLCLTTYQIFRPKQVPKDYSVSIIIPARNEQENIKGILKKIPRMGSDLEVIFIEGHSRDDTYEAIKREVENNKTRYIRARVYKQSGEGKGDAVRLGFKMAKNDILMILDADLTVNPKDLTKFYYALASGHCEFANGSRLVYPLEKQAMRTINYIGNRLFSLLFTFLLGQRIKDTLCGTKALFREDYVKIARNRKYFGNFDPFGDFDLIFGASKLNLKILDIPVRYGERRYGTTNISRFSHGLLLIKMTAFAAKKIKFA